MPTGWARRLHEQMSSWPQLLLASCRRTLSKPITGQSQLVWSRQCLYDRKAGRMPMIWRRENNKEKNVLSVKTSAQTQHGDKVQTRFQSRNFGFSKWRRRTLHKIVHSLIFFPRSSILMRSDLNGFSSCLDSWAFSIWILECLQGSRAGYLEGYFSKYWNSKVYLLEAWGNLIKNGSHKLICLNTLFLSGGTILEKLGSTALLEKVCPWG